MPSNWTSNANSLSMYPSKQKRTVARRGTYGGDSLDGKGGRGWPAGG